MMTSSRSRDQGSPFLRLPAELRLMIYHHLLRPNPANQVRIKTRERSWRPESGEPKLQRRTSYYALDRNLGRCSYKTTYSLDGSQGTRGAAMYPEIMAVNRRIHEETTYHLYASHTFHFGQYLDALGPFISDLTSTTQNLIHSLSLRCLLHSPACCSNSDSRFWGTMSQRLSSLPKLRKLNITIQGGRPTTDWNGPKELSVSDIRLLYATHHECMEWARELAAVGTLEDVEIEADVRPMPRPETTGTLIYAALSASIEGSLVQFLKEELQVPARVKAREVEPVEQLPDDAQATEVTAAEAESGEVASAVG